LAEVPRIVSCRDAAAEHIVYRAHVLESMTGFASIEHARNDIRVGVRARSVNSRYLDLRIKLPPGVSRLEARVHEAARKMIGRGKVELDVELLGGDVHITAWRVDMATATTVRDALDEVRAALDLPGCVDLALLAEAAGSELFVRSPDPTKLDRLEAVVLEAATKALETLHEARLTEGRALEADIRGGIGRVSELVASLEDATANLIDDVRARLNERLEMIGYKACSEEERRRLDQEIVMAAERADVHEEIVRLNTHIEAVKVACLPGDEPCGKRLDFLFQEVLREVNTVGAKVPRANVRATVVSLKVEVEKLRQQVANVA
jgi:uncharacterized protein (TIGR00255 family)